MSVNLDWFKCKSVGWCDLFKVDIENQYVKESEGVYICWTGTGIDDSLTVIKVGQGYIYDLLIDMRRDLEIGAFRNKGVFITWARVPNYKTSGIEKYLYEKLKPLFTSGDVSGWKTEVNMPWDQDELDGFKNQLPSSDNSELDLSDKEAKLPWQ